MLANCFTKENSDINTLSNVLGIDEDAISERMNKHSLFNTSDIVRFTIWRLEKTPNELRSVHIKIFKENIVNLAHILTINPVFKKKETAIDILFLILYQDKAKNFNLKQNIEKVEQFYIEMAISKLENLDKKQKEFALQQLLNISDSFQYCKEGANQNFIDFVNNISKNLYNDELSAKKDFLKKTILETINSNAIIKIKINNFTNMNRINEIHSYNFLMQNPEKIKEYLGDFPKIKHDLYMPTNSSENNERNAFLETVLKVINLEDLSTNLIKISTLLYLTKINELDFANISNANNENTIIGQILLKVYPEHLGYGKYRYDDLINFNQGFIKAQHCDEICISVICIYLLNNGIENSKTETHKIIIKEKIEKYKYIVDLMMQNQKKIANNNKINWPLILNDINYHDINIIFKLELFDEFIKYLSDNNNNIINIKKNIVEKINNNLNKINKYKILTNKKRLFLELLNKNDFHFIFHSEEFCQNFKTYLEKSKNHNTLDTINKHDKIRNSIAKSLLTNNNLSLICDFDTKVDTNILEEILMYFLINESSNLKSIITLITYASCELEKKEFLYFIKPVLSNKNLISNLQKIGNQINNEQIIILNPAHINFYNMISELKKNIEGSNFSHDNFMIEMVKLSVKHGCSENYSYITKKLLILKKIVALKYFSDLVIHNKQYHILENILNGAYEYYINNKNNVNNKDPLIFNLIKYIMLQQIDNIDIPGSSYSSIDITAKCYLYAMLVDNENLNDEFADEFKKVTELNCKYLRMLFIVAKYRKNSRLINHINNYQENKLIQNSKQFQNNSQDVNLEDLLKLFNIAIEKENELIVNLLIDKYKNLLINLFKSDLPRKNPINIALNAAIQGNIDYENTIFYKLINNFNIPKNKCALLLIKLIRIIATTKNISINICQDMYDDLLSRCTDEFLIKSIAKVILARTFNININNFKFIENILLEKKVDIKYNDMNIESILTLAVENSKQEQTFALIKKIANSITKDDNNSRFNLLINKIVFNYPNNQLFNSLFEKNNNFTKFLTENDFKNIIDYYIDNNISIDKIYGLLIAANQCSENYIYTAKKLIMLKDIKKFSDFCSLIIQKNQDIILEDILNEAYINNEKPLIHALINFIISKQCNTGIKASCYLYAILSQHINVLPSNSSPLKKCLYLSMLYTVVKYDKSNKFIDYIENYRNNMQVYSQNDDVKDDLLKLFNIAIKKEHGPIVDLLITEYKNLLIDLLKDHNKPIKLAFIIASRGSANYKNTIFYKLINNLNIPEDTYVFLLITLIKRIAIENASINICQDMYDDLIKKCTDKQSVATAILAEPFSINANNFKFIVKLLLDEEVTIEYNNKNIENILTLAIENSEQEQNFALIKKIAKHLFNFLFKQNNNFVRHPNETNFEHIINSYIENNTLIRNSYILLAAEISENNIKYNKKISLSINFLKKHTKKNNTNEFKNIYNKLTELIQQKDNNIINFKTIISQIYDLYLIDKIIYNQLYNKTLNYFFVNKNIPFALKIKFFMCQHKHFDTLKIDLQAIKKPINNTEINSNFTKFNKNYKYYKIYSAIFIMIISLAFVATCYIFSVLFLGAYNKINIAIDSKKNSYKYI